MSARGWEPVVSVVIPAHNASSYIADTLNSALRQTYLRREVILIDDGSDDQDLLDRELAAFGDRVRCLRQVNAGPSAARNAGIRAAQGELVAFLDSDDLWEPDFLALQVARFQRDPSLDLVWANCCRLNAPETEGTQFDAYPPRRPVTLESLVRIENVPVTSTTVARRQTVIAAGLFDESMRRCEDFDLWLRMASRGARFDFQEKVLAKRRHRPTSLSADVLAMSEGAALAYSKLEKTVGISHPLTAAIRSSREKYVAGAQQELAKKWMDEGKWDEAIRCLAEANRTKRTLPRSVFLGLASVSMPAARAAARWWRRKHLRDAAESGRSAGEA